MVEWISNIFNRIFHYKKAFYHLFNSSCLQLTVKLPDLSGRQCSSSRKHISTGSWQSNHTCLICLLPVYICLPYFIQHNFRLSGYKKTQTNNNPPPLKAPPTLLPFWQYCYQKLKMRTSLTYAKIHQEIQFS